MKKWQQRFIAIATALGFMKKVKDGKLTADEQKQIFAEYEKKYKVTFEADKAADEDAETEERDFILSETEQQEIANLINDDDGDDSGEDDEEGEGNETPKTGKEANAAMKKTIIKQKKTIQTLASKPEEGTPVKVIGAGNVNESRMIAIVMGHTPHTAAHLFGNECDFMSLGKWWNRITKDRREVDLKHLTEEEKDDFKKAFTAYGKSLVDRSVQLTESNAISLLDYKKMISGTSPFTDYTGLDAKFGEFTVRRQDIILAFFRSLPSVANIFPVQSGVRNKEVVPTVQFGELSQGWREGRIFKGNVKFSAEIYWVNDVMFKYNFTDMVELQKRYVMDLHRGSTDIQWTFIEWVIMWFGQQLFNEQQRRRVVGVRVPPQDVIANPAMLAADGALRAIQRAEEELKVLPFDLGIYNETSIVDYVELFWDAIDEILPNMQDIQLFMNLKHQPWYLRNFRQKYGTDSDFTGTRNSLIDVNPRYIVWVPNMPMNNYKVWATSPGNIQNLEYLPNEMLGFIFWEGYESVSVRSRWMEGSVVQKVGVQYKTLAELEASKRQNQWLFTNFPVTKLDPDVTAINGKLNMEYSTGANTKETVLADITNASEESVYKIICGSMTNATKITKSGEFAKITEDWTPGAVGDYIKVYAELEDYTVSVEGKSYKATRPTGNFLELERKVTA